MKKTVLIALSALFTFAACQKAPVAQNEEKTEAKEIVFKIAVNHSEDTKAVKTNWADGDKVYVFFEGVAGVKYVTLTRDGSNWNASLEGITANDLIEAKPANMYAVFFPYEQPVIATDGGDGVTFKTGGHDNAAIDGLSIYTYYMTASSACNVTDDGGGIASIEGTLNMAIPSGYVQFFINENSTNYNVDYEYRLSVEGIKPTACVSYSTGTFGTKELNIAQPMWGYKHGTSGIAFSGVIDETWEDSNNSHVVYLFDTNDAAKWIAINGKKLESHDAVNFSTNHPSACTPFDSSNPEPTATWKYAVKAPDTITAGGIKWGTFNLGATAAGTDPENYGWYFLWGDIIPARSIATAPTNYARTAYFYNTIAYEALAGKKVNLTENYAIYDMATAFLGSPWRMPTGGDSGELKALFDLGVTYEVGAVIVNDALLTIPMAGYWYYNNSTDNKYEYAGTRYNVWSSTYDTKIVGNACGVSVYNHVKDINSEYNWRQVKSSDQCNRMNGNSVLPVQDAD